MARRGGRPLDAPGVGGGTRLFVSVAAGGVGSAASRDVLRLLGAESVTYGEGMAEGARALAPDGVGGARNVATLADLDGAKQHSARQCLSELSKPAYREFRSPRGPFA